MVTALGIRSFKEALNLNQTTCTKLLSIATGCCLSSTVSGHCYCLSSTQRSSISINSCRYLSRFVEGTTSAKTRLSPPWRMVFFGTDDYALSHLKTLNENRLANDEKLVETLEVVVPHTKCAVSSYAEQSNLKVHKWPLAQISSEYDLGVVVSFGHLIPKRVIDAFPYGILNVHPSILPRWRGSSPIMHTILNGDEETGISIMEIRPLHFDTGPLLLQTKFAVPENCTTFQLRDYLVDEGCTMLMAALKDLPSLEKLEYEQDEYGVTYACHARVDWERQNAKDIDRQYRALSEVYGLRSQWKDQPVRLLDMVPPIEMLADDITNALDSTFPEQLMTVRPGIAHYLSHREVLCIRCKVFIYYVTESKEVRMLTGTLLPTKYEIRKYLWNYNWPHARLTYLPQSCSDNENDGWVGFRGIILRKLMTAKSFYNGYLSRPELRAVAFVSLPNKLDKLMFKIPAATLAARLRMNGAATCSLTSHFLAPNLALMNIRS